MYRSKRNVRCCEGGGFKSVCSTDFYIKVVQIRDLDYLSLMMIVIL